MKVMIIGAAGFIGCHLAEFLTGTVELFTADVVSMDYPNHVVTAQDSPDFGAIFADIRPDICINCAGAANVGLSFQDPANDFDLNVVLVHRLLEAIRVHSPDTRFINLSSAAVYGNPQTVPIVEDSPFAPISPYGCHKMAAESLCREYAVCFGLKTQALRVFSVFGPGLRKQLFWDIFQKSRKADQIICPGTGDETRDFIYIADMARAIGACMSSAPFDGGVINVANGEGVTIRRAVASLLSGLEWKGELLFNGVVRDGDPLYWTADISRLRKIGYTSAHSFESGIGGLTEWLKTLP